MMWDDSWRGNAVTIASVAAAAPNGTGSLGEGGQLFIGAPSQYKTRPGPVTDEGTGYCNGYIDYLSQCSELYRMLEGAAAYGAEQTRSILSYRTSFLSGEGARVSADTSRLKDWIDDWMRAQGLTGRSLTDAVSESEVVGHVLWTIDDEGRAVCHPAFVGYDGWTGARMTPYALGYDWAQPVWWPQFDGLRLEGISRRSSTTGGDYEPWLETSRDRLVYIRTGGHGNVARFPAPTTRLGLAIDSLKNYDRAVRQARQINDTSTRQSPTWEIHPTDDATDETELREYLSTEGWDIGAPIVSRAKFSVVGSPTAPVETLQREAGMVVKDLSAVTGVPPHWLGYTDLLANRATADSLFEAIAASTHVERLAWEQGLTDMIGHARRVLGGPAGDFRVTLPLLSFRQFAPRNESLLALHQAGIISPDDVRSQLPFDVVGDDDDMEAPSANSRPPTDR